MTDFQRAVARRTIPAVPGSSDRFIEKARSLPVDGLFLDLEDAVAPAAQAESRRRVVDALNFARAQRIMTAYAPATDAANGSVGAIVVDDEMVDEAGVKLAAAILARGRAAGMEVNA